MIALWLGCDPTPTAPIPPPPPEATALPGPGEHAGSDACARCHADATSTWRRSHHARAERPADAFADALGPSPRVELPHADDPQEVVRWIGVSPVVQPLIAASHGGLQVGSRAYDPSTDTWFGVFDDPREPGDVGHWTGAAMTWDTMCAPCHDTGVQHRWDRSTDTHHTTLAELGVGCEGCHGPSARHAAAPRAEAVPEPAPTCEGCHVRGEPLAGASLVSDLWLDAVVPSRPGLDPSWAVDGQLVDETFEALPFRLTTMHQAGVGCSTCHDPHGDGTRSEGDALCRGCHDAVGPDPSHSRHRPQDAGCVDCHMPTTTYMQRDVRHDHGFPVPDPGLALELDLATSCDACHPPVQGARAHLQTARSWWTPAPQRRARTHALHAARAGDEDAGPRILAALETETQPVWRSALLAALGPFEEHGEDVLASALTSTDPWARLGAAEAMAQRPWDPDDLARSLADEPRAAVALALARALAPHRPPDDPLLAPLRHQLEARGHHPAPAAELAAWWRTHGRADHALPWAEHAASHDVRHPDLQALLGLARASAGDATGALAAMEEAVRLDPDTPDRWFRLALARAGVDDLDGAASALRRALLLDPDHARATHNLGLVLLQRHDPDAVAVLTRAQALAPTDPDVGHTLALALEQSGDRDGARRAATRVLSEHPSHRATRALLRRLGAPAPP